MTNDYMLTRKTGFKLASIIAIRYASCDTEAERAQIAKLAEVVAETMIPPHITQERFLSMCWLNEGKDQ